MFLLYNIYIYIIYIGIIGGLYGGLYFGVKHGFIGYIEFNLFAGPYIRIYIYIVDYTCQFFGGL